MAKDRKTCPKCGITGRVDKLFGYRRNMQYDIIPQSWCYLCRKGGKKNTNPTLSVGNMLPPIKEANKLRKRFQDAFDKTAKPPVTYEEVCNEYKMPEDDCVIRESTARGVNHFNETYGRTTGMDAMPSLVELRTNTGPVAPPDATPVSVICPDRALTKSLYRGNFPGDKQIRGWKFMVKKLMKKLGSQVVLTAEAKTELWGGF